MKKEAEKYNLSQILKKINLSNAQIFVVEQVFKNSEFTEQEWIAQLKEKKII